MKKYQIAAACLVLSCLFLPLKGLAAGLFVDVGDILTANYLGNRVVKTHPQTGVQESLGEFTTPTDLVLMPNGDLYVSELGGTINRLRLTNGVVTVINPATSMTAALGMARGPSGDLFVTASGNRVLKVNPATGAETLVTQGNHLSMPTGIEFLNATNLVVASFSNSKIVKVSLVDGSQTVIASGGIYVDRPWGLAVSGDSIYSGQYDSKFINRISASAGTVTYIATAAGFPYGMGLDAAGNLLVGGAASTPGQNDVLMQFSPQGATLASFDVGLLQQITGIEVSPARFGSPPTNTAPVLAPIGNKTVNEGTLLSFQVTASDSNQPPQILTFALEAGAPTGANITTSGGFTWTPTESQGGSSYSVTVRVTDSGSPTLSDSETMVITVNEVNSPPAITPVEDHTVFAGNTLNFQLYATDSDIPSQNLTFSLGTNAPASATLSPTGLFVWIPPSNQPPGTNVLAVRVADDGIPWLSTTQTIRVIVRKPLVIEVGDILAANLSGNCVVQINPRTSAQQLLAAFDMPTDLALSSNGVLYVSERGGLIKRLDLSNGAITVVNPGTTLSEVWGMVLGPDGALYVTCSANDSVVRVNPATGAETVLSSGNWLFGPLGIARLNSQQLVVSSADNNSIVSVALANGAQSLLAQESGLDLPWDVTVAGSNIYVSGYSPQLIHRVSNGSVYTVCLVPDGLPQAIAVAGNGDIVFSVGGVSNNALMWINPQGEVVNSCFGDLIGEITGLEVSTVRIGPVVPQVYLQSCQSVGGPYYDEPYAVWQEEAQSINLPRPADNRCYRLRGTQAMRIRNVRTSKTRLWMDYEFP